MNQPKISVIVPIYNTEKYLYRCIDSVLNQRFKNFEILLINDGSTDLSGAICDEYALKDDRIRVFHKDNGGQSTARNIGFHKALGDYIFCLDSDDYIDGEKLIDVISTMENNNLDLLPIQILSYNSNGILVSLNDFYPQFLKPITGVEFMNKFTVYGAMCAYVYKASVIKKYNLQLIENIYHEDEEFIMQYLLKAERIIYNKIPIYKQEIRPDSTTNNSNREHRKELIEHILIVLASLLRTSSNYSLDSLEYKGLMKKIQQLSISVVIRSFKDKLPIEFFENIINHLKKQGLYPFKTSFLTFKFKVFSIFLNKPIVLNFMYGFFKK